MTTATTTLADLTTMIKAFEADIAPGSETSLWGDYLDRMRQVTGSLPLGDYDGSLPVPTDEAGWWLAAYKHMQDNPEADMDAIRNAADNFAASPQSN